MLLEAGSAAELETWTHEHYQSRPFSGRTGATRCRCFSGLTSGLKGSNGLRSGMTSEASPNGSSTGRRPAHISLVQLDHVRKPTGHVETRHVIDGQQRLTTIQLLMEAFADYCASKGIEKHQKPLVKLTRNDDPMSEDPDEQFKVWPTHLDQARYRQVMAAAGPKAVRAAYDVDPSASSGQPIVDAYLFFWEAIAAWIDAGVLETRLDALLSAIREHLRMVVIDLDRDDDPQLILETLNARGTPLLPSDLVKNFVFHRGQIDKLEIGELYDKYWRLFDVESKYWRGSIGRGHARRARIDLFLQHYLTLKTRDDVPIGHLYNAFRDYASDGKAGNAQQIIASIRRYADTYQSFDSMPIGTRRRLFFERLEAMDVARRTRFFSSCCQVTAQIWKPSMRSW